MLTITELVKEVVECLVDTPDKVQIEEKSGERTTVINIVVPKEEVGKIIGREGKIITSIRTICENIAAKHSKRVNIHIID
jgi:predicted RNA-binding protein YlqC (UPF0109 family)